jgi:hypothetical protein
MTLTLSRKVLKVLLFSTLLASLACKKEASPRSTTPIKDWRNNSKFQGGTGIKTNLAASENELYALGPYYLSVLDAHYNTHHYIIQNRGIYKFPMGDELYMDLLEGSRISFNSIKRPIDYATGAQLVPSSLDSTYSKYYLDFLIKDEVAALSDQNQAMFSFRSTEGNKLALVKIRQNAQRDYHIHSQEVIPFSALDNSTRLGLIRSVNSVFYVGTDQGFFRIDSTGQHLKVLENSVFRVFKSDGQLYATGGPDKLFISQDNGVNWTTHFGLPEDFVYAHYFEIGDSLIGMSTFGPNLFTLHLTDSQWRARYLDDKGLEGYYLTSIVEFNDSIYISSLDGIFTKSLQDFYRTKK